MIKFKSLNKSSKFQSILKKKKINNKYFNIFFDKNFDNSEKNKKVLNISFVMKKKIGNAVVRNKIKRRLKAAVQKFLREKESINLNRTYVIFGRNNVYKDKFQLVYYEISNAFKKINQMKV